MILREFRDPLAGPQLRWLAPILATTLGGLCGGVGLFLLWAGEGGPGPWLFTVLGSAAFAAGVLGLAFRIAARAAAETWREDRLDHRADLAVLVSLVVFSTAQATFGAAIWIEAAQPARMVEGRVEELRLEWSGTPRGRYREATLMLQGGRVFRWSCWRNCGPYATMRSLRAGDWPAHVRVTAIGERMIGLETPYRRFLSPEAERKRLRSFAAVCMGVSLLFGALLALRARKMARQGPGSEWSMAPWRD